MADNHSLDMKYLLPNTPSPHTQHLDPDILDNHQDNQVEEQVAKVDLVVDLHIPSLPHYSPLSL